MLIHWAWRRSHSCVPTSPHSHALHLTVTGVLRDPFLMYGIHGLQQQWKVNFKIHLGTNMFQWNNQAYSANAHMTWLLDNIMISVCYSSNQQPSLLICTPLFEKESWIVLSVEHVWKALYTIKSCFQNIFLLQPSSFHKSVVSEVLRGRREPFKYLWGWGFSSNTIPGSLCRQE